MTGVDNDTVTEWSFATPHGHMARFKVRPKTSDWNTVNAISAVGDEYHLPEGLSGWAMDIGAHIGAATVCLLLDNPDLRVIAIEALPENVALMRENLVLNAVDDRALVILGAASDSPAEVSIGYGEIADPTLIHEYIGNANAPAGSRMVQVQGVTLRGAMLLRGPDQDVGIVWMKIDCEGCEYAFLASRYLRYVHHIEGEVHFGGERLRTILAPTHDVTFPRWDENPDFGPFVAIRRVF